MFPLPSGFNWNWLSRVSNGLPVGKSKPTIVKAPWNDELVGAGEASGAAIKRSLKPLSVLLPTKIPFETKPKTESPLEIGLLRKP